jgi:hypothetical protein
MGAAEQPSVPVSDHQNLLFSERSPDGILAR